MNLFRFAGDMSHLIGLLVLFLQIYATKSCSGISLKTQELYAIVFLARYLDLLTVFISVYNTVIKMVFNWSSLAIVLGMRYHPAVKQSYDRELDTFRHFVLIAVCFLLALLIYYKFPFQEIFYAISIYLEEVAILPQLVLLQRSGNVDNLTYVFFLGAYCALYIINWYYRYLMGEGYDQVFFRYISGLVQMGLYAVFFYYYYISWKKQAKLELQPEASKVTIEIDTQKLNLCV